jgi:enoyl-CoA hydratase
LPGELGAFCALTGERLGADDGVAATVATHRVLSSRLPDLADALCGAVSVDATLAAFAEPAGATKLAPHRTAIDQLFKGNRVEDILTALDAAAADAAFAKDTAATIRVKSRRREAFIPGVHADRIPHSVPRHSWPRLL